MLQLIDVSHDGEQDPTRPGPVTLPWIVNLDDSVNWNQPLSTVMEAFNDWVSTSDQYGSASYTNDDFRII
jgi:hypothetical protein